MKHNILISVSKKKCKGILSCKKVRLREKIMRLLLGDLKKVMILVPGDSVQEVSIKEYVPGGGTDAF